MATYWNGWMVENAMIKREKPTVDLLVTEPAAAVISFQKSAKKTIKKSWYWIIV